MFNDLDFFHPGFTRNLLQVGGWLERQFQMLKYKKQTTGTCVALGRCYSLAVDVFFCMGVGVVITVWKAEHTVTQKQRFLKSSCFFHDVESLFFPECCTQCGWRKSAILNMWTDGVLHKKVC